MSRLCIKQHKEIQSDIKFSTKNTRVDLLSNKKSAEHSYKSFQLLSISKLILCPNYKLGKLLFCSLKMGSSILQLVITNLWGLTQVFLGPKFNGKVPCLYLNSHLKVFHTLNFEYSMLNSLTVFQNYANI